MTNNNIVSNDREHYERLTLILHDQPIEITGYINGYTRMKPPFEILTTYQLDNIRAEFNTLFIDNGLVVSDIGLEQSKENSQKWLTTISYRKLEKDYIEITLGSK